jgi:hypothetical protein
MGDLIAITMTEFIDPDEVARVSAEHGGSVGNYWLAITLTLKSGGGSPTWHFNRETKWTVESIQEQMKYSFGELFEKRGDYFGTKTSSRTTLAPLPSQYEVST